MSRKWCRHHREGRWCISGCVRNRRVCHRFVRGEECIYAFGCKCLHPSRQKTDEEQRDGQSLPRQKTDEEQRDGQSDKQHPWAPAEPKAMPKPKRTTPSSHAKPKAKQKTTLLRPAVSPKAAEALRVLGLDPNTRISKEQITANFRSKARFIHPDKVEQQAKENLLKDVQQAQENMQALNNAKDFLDSFYP
jgi:hypothetical protein